MNNEYYSNTNNQLISVVIPTYNREKYIKRAVESVLKQSYPNIEVIIIDDGSVDKTPLILSAFSKNDSRIKIIKNEINLGFAKSLNKGISTAKGRYIARLDDDDFWLSPKKLEKQIEFLEKNPDYILVGSGAIRINEEGKEISRYLFPEKDEDIRKSILIENLFAHISTVFRKEAWVRVGGYDEEIDFFSDWDLWLKLGKIGKFYNLQEYLACYLEEEERKRRSDCKIRRKIKLHIKMKKKYRNDYPGFKKAFLLCWANYFYSFLPFGKKLYPFYFKLRNLIFGSPAYKNF